MLQIKSILLLAILFPRCCRSNNYDLILKFMELKKVELIELITCNRKESMELQNYLSEHFIRSAIIEVDYFIVNHEGVIENASAIYYNSYGYVLDLHCANSRRFLNLDADLTKWNSRFGDTYKWLLLDLENSIVIEDYFNEAKLRLDSEVFVARQEGNSYKLREVYNPGGFGRKIVSRDSMIFSKGSFRFVIESNFYLARKNLSGSIIKTTTVITKNITSTAEEYLVNRKNIDDAVNKLNFALFLHIVDMHEFKYRIMTTYTWYGPSPSGIDGGLPKHLYYREADVSATSGIMTRDRITAVDYLISTYYFGTCFIFRNPSAVGKIRNQFFDPFAEKTWCICLLFLIILTVFIKATFYIHGKLSKTRSEKGSWSSSVLNTLAAFCQQDIETDEDNLTGRILILSLMVLSLLLYNYYTSSIVSDLINSRTAAFSTIGELVHSNLDLGMEDIAYTERLFKTTIDPDIIYLRDKKILAPGKKPNYFNPTEGIARVKSGGFAYHVEPATGYPLIAKTFDSSQICDLCEIYVFKPTLIYVLAQKNSQYKRLFSISYRKLMERGLMRRETLIWQAQKPECLSSANVLQIELEQVAPAFFVLSFGIIASLLILAFEYRIKLKPTNK